MVEACIHKAHPNIADEGFKEPGSSSEAFGILADHGVLTRNAVTVYERMARFRNRMVHPWAKVGDALVYGVFRNHLDDFGPPVTHIRSVVDKAPFSRA